MSTTSPATLWEYDRSVDATSDPYRDAALALMVQDAANPVALLGMAHRMTQRIYHSGGDTPTVEFYPAYRLLLLKLADMSHLPTSIHEYEENYLMCKQLDEHFEAGFEGTLTDNQRVLLAMKGMTPKGD